MSRLSRSSWRLEAALRTRGFRNIAAFHAVLFPKLGLSYYQTRRLVSGDFISLPRIDTLDVICDTLQCSILDILDIDYRVRPLLVDTAQLRVSKRKWKRPRESRHRIKPGDPTNVEPLDIDDATTLIDANED